MRYFLNVMETEWNYILKCQKDRQENGYQSMNVLLFHHICYGAMVVSDENFLRIIV